MLIVTGLYRFAPKRVGFKNDYCVHCNAPTRSVQVRTFDAFHLFYLPVVPLGFWKRWFCSRCNHQPHTRPGTRRPMKWAGLMAIVMLAGILWLAPVEPDFVAGTWILRILLPIAALVVLRHLLLTPPDKPLRELLAQIAPASDMSCPFCSTVLMVAEQCSCPNCGVVRY